MRFRLPFAALQAASLSIACMVGPSPASGQPAGGSLIDGYTIGVGLAVYQGDLDRNPENKPGQFVASGSVHIMAGVDRPLTGGRLGLELHYNRLFAENLLVSGHHNVLSLDATYGRRIGRSGVIAFTGLGPALVLSRYGTQSVSADLLGIANGGTGFDLTIPVGLILQDRVRIGTRVALLDRVDGTDKLGGHDLLSNISIAYRFARGR